MIPKAGRSRHAYMACRRENRASSQSWVIRWIQSKHWLITMRFQFYPSLYENFLVYRCDYFRGMMNSQLISINPSVFWLTVPLWAPSTDCEHLRFMDWLMLRFSFACVFLVCIFSLFAARSIIRGVFVFFAARYLQRFTFFFKLVCVLLLCVIFCSTFFFFNLQCIPPFVSCLAPVGHRSPVRPGEHSFWATGRSWNLKYFYTAANLSLFKYKLHNSTIFRHAYP